MVIFCGSFCNLCLFYCIFSLQLCDHLLGKGCPLVSLGRDVFVYFVTFPCCVLGRVRYLIVLIPDLCLRLYCATDIFYIVKQCNILCPDIRSFGIKSVICYCFEIQKVSENDKGIPQPHTADQPSTP